MSFIPPGFAEVTMQFAIGGGDHYSYCVFGVENIANLGPEYIADNVGINMNESLLTLLCDSTTLREIRVVTGEDLFHVSTINESGDIVSPQATPQVAYLLKKVTNVIGKKNRGRMYLPGVQETMVGNTGFVDGTRAADLTVAGNFFLAKQLADDIPMYLLHSNPADAPNFVDRLECDTKVATQRRRLR
jgi:hypothetical protein